MEKNKIIESGTGTNFGFEESNKDYYKNNKELYTAVQPYPELNEIINAVLVVYDEETAIFSGGYKTDIIIPIDENEKSIIENLNVGDECELLICSIMNTRKKIELIGSLYKCYRYRLNEKVNEILEVLYEKKEIFTGTPISYNVYGYDVSINVDFEEVLIHMPHLLTDVNKLPDPASIIGQEIQFKVIKDEDGNFIASRKDYLLILAKQELKKLVIGNIYTGFVTGTCDYAVFVQIGNLTGMVHKSNLTDQAKELLLSDKIEPGMEIEVYLKEINRGRLTLTQIWKESLWDTIEVDEILTGTICSIKHFNNTDFGVLVKFDFETKGMIHSSNLNKPASSFEIGQKIEVYVQSINKQKRQITLMKYEE